MASRAASSALGRLPPLRSICPPFAAWRGWAAPAASLEANVPASPSRRPPLDGSRLPSEDQRIPVTILTGFLGAGKTTLLNRILGGDHGLRLAVIQNEFGEVGVDHLLTEGHFKADEGIHLMNNGCLCCTVRSDLAPIIRRLYESQAEGGKLDGIVVETTGLAVPGPVLQTFLSDSPAELTRLDSVITLVDAVNAGRHLSALRQKPALASSAPAALAASAASAKTASAEGSKGPNEFVEQIAFADLLLLNKCDLVQEEQLVEVEAQIRAINPQAPLIRCKHAEGVPLERLLGVRAFDLERIAMRELWSDSQADDHGHGHSHGHGHGHGHRQLEARHDAAVRSVSLLHEGWLDAQRLERWLGNLLEERGDDIYRFKGVLAVGGPPGSEDPGSRLVCQGVHALFQSEISGTFGAGEPPASRLVFIGKGLNQDELRAGLLECAADS